MATNDETYVPILQSLQKWDWYKNVFKSKLLIHFIINANYSTNVFRGIELKKGQYLCTINILSEQTGISYKSIVKYINELESDGEVSIIRRKGWCGGLIITVNNYDKYIHSFNRSNKKSNLKDDIDYSYIDNPEMIDNGF